MLLALVSEALLVKYDENEHLVLVHQICMLGPAYQQAVKSPTWPEFLLLLNHKERA